MFGQDLMREKVLVFVGRTIAAMADITFSLHFVLVPPVENTGPNFSSLHDNTHPCCQ